MSSTTATVASSLPSSTTTISYRSSPRLASAVVAPSMVRGRFAASLYAGKKTLSSPALRSGSAAFRVDVGRAEDVRPYLLGGRDGARPAFVVALVPAEEVRYEHDVIVVAGLQRLPPLVAGAHVAERVVRAFDADVLHEVRQVLAVQRELEHLAREGEPSVALVARPRPDVGGAVL